MTKRLFGAFGVLLSICMMFSMLSLSAKADGMAEAIVSLSEDTPIEVGSLTELQEIVNNAGQDLYIKLAADYNRVEAETETGTAIGTGRLTISNHSNYNITIDLNGQTMDGGSGTAILHDDYGTLTIMDSSMDQRGIVTSKSTENGQATINNSYRGGHLEIKGGTIENTAVTGSTIDVISNTGYGNITVSGGHVRVNNAADGSEACAIRNTDLGNVIITAGTVTVNASFGYAIYNARGSSVNGAEVRISGGTVSAAGGADAIHNRYYGWVMISGGIVSAEQGRAIYNDGVDEYYDGHFGRLVITGGTISSNTGNAIYNNNTGKIKISGTATITSAKAGIDSGTIYLKQGTSDTIMLLLEGGTIENTSETGNGIYNNDIGTVNILGGTTRISGGNLAMNTAPTLGNQFIYKIMADKTRADALDAQEIARDDIKTQIQQYKYIQFEPLEIFRVGAAGYTTLQDAIAAVADGGTIELLRDISPAAALTVTGTKSFTLDLKGKVLNGGTNTALSHEGSKTLIITDTDSSGAGKITNNSSSYAALKNNGTLHVAGGTVAGTTMAIANYENLTVSGGMVVAFRAIYNWMGRLEMTGGVVNSDNGIAIDNYEDSTVVISGGIVDGNEGYAIQSLTSGCVTISGTALVTNNHSNPTIWLKGEGVIIGTPLSLIISGGKVENLSTGNAIYGSKDAYINISGGTISSSNGKAIDITTNSVLRLLRGEITIKGKTGILGQEDQVDFSTYGPNRLLVSTAKSDGTETSERSLWDIQSGFISIYNCKYMQFEPITLTEPAAKNIDTGNVYADLLEAIYNVGDGQTIQLQKDIPNLDYDIEIPYYPDVSFILDLNGHTMTFVGNTRFNVHGGTLTITDSGSGGKITGSMTNTSNGTINLFFTGSLHLIGGTIERRNMINPAIYSASSGNVIISGGTVSADRTAIYNDSSSGRVIITDGLVSSAGYQTIYSKNKVIIPSGSPVISGGQGVMNMAPDLSSYHKVQVTAAYDVNGTSRAAEYNESYISLYNYITFSSSTDTTISNLDLTSILTAPATGGTPMSTIDTSEYTGTVSWNGNPDIFQNNQAYTATLTLTAKENYTFSGVEVNAFAHDGASGASNARGTGKVLTVTLTFQAIVDKTPVPAANLGLKWTGDMLTGVNSGIGYSLDGDYQARDVGTYEAIATLLSGYTWSDGSTEPKTILWSIAKASGPAVGGVSATDCTTEENNDGQLIGLTLAMEIKRAEDEAFIPVSAVSGSAIVVSGSAIIAVGDKINITGLPNGAYMVRLAATATHEAGPTTTFRIKPYTPTPALTYTISGTVADRDNNRGIAGAAVQLKSGGSNIGSVVFTDANGAYTMSGVSAGIYSLEVSADGYMSSSTDSFDVTDVNIDGLNINLAKAAPTPTPNPNPNPDPGPSFEPASVNTAKPEGKVEVDQEQEEGAPAVNVNNSSDELKASVLTPEEQELVARGEDVKVVLKVTDISAAVSEEEKKLIQDRLAEELGIAENDASGNGASDIAAIYIDLTLYKQVGKQEETKVTETRGKISISIEVPEEFRNWDETMNRSFFVLRLHNGEVSRLEGTYDAKRHIFTFETDRFSTYALTYQDSSALQTYEDFYHLRLTAKTGKTSQTLSYKRAANVDGYLIYGGKCGEEMTLLADLPAKTTSYTVKNLKAGTNYKYQVKAYRIINGKQVVIMTSKVIHTTTEGKTYADPTKVTTNTASVKLIVGKAKTITAQAVMPKGKKLAEHTPVIRYESNDPEIATINSKGKITAKAKGTCYVYAYAQNGLYKRIKVTVE